jgi:Domain of unknown function (DUF4265)
VYKGWRNYIIDNIPFVAKRIALGDAIKAEYEADENAYYFDDFVSVSGNTTVRLYFSDDTLIEVVKNQLIEMGCETETFLARKILAVNVPYNLGYKPVKEYLDEGELQEKWEYEESCLAHNIT